MRFLRAISEIASERNTTTILPRPMEFFGPLMKKSDGGQNT